jgi:hypothetical protein
MNRTAAGSVAGIVATAPMTAVMLMANREMPWRDHYKLPPRLITMDVSKKVLGRTPSGESTRKALSLVAHFGYGASVGAGYGATTRSCDLPRSAIQGVGYGLAVWGLSYLGWLPTLGMRASATRESWRRNAMMIGAHVVWGMTTGAVTELLAQPSEGPGENVRSPDDAMETESFQEGQQVET